MLTPITNSPSPGGTSISRVLCMGTPAWLQAMRSLPKAHSASVNDQLLQRRVDPHRHDAPIIIRAGQGVCRLRDRIFFGCRP
jgi:hypothetical protein